MKVRKQKGSLRDRLSADYLKAFQEDFAANGVAAIKSLRQESPAKYAEIASRLIAATTEPTDPDSLCGVFAGHWKMVAAPGRLYRADR
jgi:hypothetical protein